MAKSKSNKPPSLSETKAAPKKASSLHSAKTVTARKPSSSSKSPKPVKKVIAEIVEESPKSTQNTDAKLARKPSRLPATRRPASSARRGGSGSNSDERDVSESSALTSTADPINQYLAEVRRYPLLTKEQELEIAKIYFDTKDPKAAQALVTANLRFVVKVAAEYSKFGARMIDLVQEGNMGLMHAVRDFNPYKGVRLITYAVWWIRGYIQEYLMKQYSLVKIGTTHNQKKLFYQLQKQKRALEAMGETPDIKMIASKLGVSEDEVTEMSQRISGRDVSLDQPASGDGGTTFKDLQRGVSEAPDEQLSRNEELTRLKTRIATLRPTLNEREKILLEERILSDEPLTLQEIGEKYSITREAVRQAETRLMKKIKELYERD
jgi:RNA polymerase sigma-32 factor